MIEGAQRDVLTQLFLDGPTEDGDICSKQARSDLYDAGLVDRFNGQNFLTAEGVEQALALRIDRQKEERRRDSNRRFFVGGDDSGHEYVVPVDRRADWEAWRDIPSDDERSWHVPDFACAIGGSLEFTWPKEGDVAIVHEVKKGERIERAMLNLMGPSHSAPQENECELYRTIRENVINGGLIGYGITWGDKAHEMTREEKARYIIDHVVNRDTSGDRCLTAAERIRF